MKLTRLTIQNLRCFTDLDLAINGQSLVLVSENAGGKTTLLQSVAWALGHAAPSLTRADFIDDELPISIAVEITGLSPDQHAAFHDAVEFPSDRPMTLRVGLRVVWDSASEQVEAEHLLSARNRRSTREQRNLLRVFWLPAWRDPSRLLAPSARTSLLAQSMTGPDVAAAAQSAAAAIGAAGAALSHDPALADVLSTVRDQLDGLLPEVPGNALSLEYPGSSDFDLLRQLELMVGYRGDGVPVPRQSSGLGQLAIFSFALHLIAQDEEAVVLIDEPEISLHPQVQRSLVRRILSRPNQTLIATHSSNVVSRADPRIIGRLERASSPRDVRVVRAPALTDPEAAALARYATADTAEAFFARAVILVEGEADRLVMANLAARLGLDLDSEGISLLEVGGANTVKSYLQLLGAQGFGLRLAGLCDEDKEANWRSRLEEAGLGEGLDRASAEGLGFFVAVKDLEDELVRALGETETERVVADQGEASALEKFRNQVVHRDKPHADQLRDFLQGRGRKVAYAVPLSSALALDKLPGPLEGCLQHIRA